MSLITCKKCGGPHLTLKCGKESVPVKTIQIKPPTIQYEKRSMYVDKKTITTVRLSNLPDDIRLDELEELMHEWGYIARINLNNGPSKSGFIEFYNKADAEYFIKAVDRTPFDSHLLSAEIIDSNRNKRY